MRRETKGIFAMLVAAFLWSLGGLFIKLIDWNSITIAGARSLIAAVFILATMKKPKFTFSVNQIVAAVANAGTMLLFIYANKHTTSANAILLQYGAPVYIMLLSGILVKERPAPEQVGALIAIVAGMGLFFSDSLQAGHLMGDIVAVLSGFTFAIHILFMRRQKEGSPLESLFLSHALTAVIGIVASLFLPAPVINVKSVAAIFGLGILQIGVAGLAFSYSIVRISAIQGSLIAIIEPALNPVWVFLVVGEVPSSRAIVGGIIIVAAVVLSSVLSVSRAARVAQLTNAAQTAQATRAANKEAVV